MALVFLISTHCPNLHLELSQLARTLPEASFLLFLSVLGPHSLLVSAITHRSLEQPLRLTPVLRMMLHLTAGQQSNSCTPTELVPVAVDLHDTLSGYTRPSNIPEISQLKITSLSHESSSSRVVQPSRSVTHPPSSTGCINTTNVKPPHPTALRVINYPSSLSIKKSPLNRVVYRDWCPQRVKRPRTAAHLVAVGAASTKRTCLNSEN